jgi:hypothetical protein
MTSQTKRFIELADLVAFRFRCKGEGCGAELCLPLQANFSRDRSADTCPNCGANWLAITNGVTTSSTAQTLERFVKSIQDISRWPGQFDLTLEVKPDPEESK